MLFLPKQFWIGVSTALWLVGCASPGVPKAPSLHLPEKVTGLQAERVGAEVRLHWTTPANTTDGEAIRTVSTAVVCRVPARTGGCVPVRQLAVTPGPAETEDVLPGTLRVGADSVVEYRVELKNDRGRSAGMSDSVFAAGGRAPEMPAGVAAESRREGVLITWQPESGGAPSDVMELHRTGPARLQTTQKPAQTPVKKVTPFAQKQSPEDSAVVLVADGQGLAGGMLDHSARSGETYLYTAQRMRTVHAAGKTLEMRSAPSVPVTVAYRNTFAPPAPTGLASVLGGGFGAALSVDLSWEPNEEAGLVGYRVYRSTNGGPAVLLTAKPVLGTAYRDLQVSAGKTYAYHMTTVDEQGNESAPSAEQRETLR